MAHSVEASPAESAPLSFSLRAKLDLCLHARSPFAITLLFIGSVFPQDVPFLSVFEWGLGDGNVDVNFQIFVFNHPQFSKSYRL